MGWPRAPPEGQIGAQCWWGGGRGGGGLESRREGRKRRAGLLRGEGGARLLTSQLWLPIWQGHVCPALLVRAQRVLGTRGQHRTGAGPATVAEWAARGPAGQRQPRARVQCWKRGCSGRRGHLHSKARLAEASGGLRRLPAFLKPKARGGGQIPRGAPAPSPRKALRPCFLASQVLSGVGF